jgi:hypothetical protein
LNGLLPANFSVAEKERDMAHVIAIQKGEDLIPAEAIVVDEKKSNILIHWWQNMAWELIELSPDLFKNEYDYYRPFLMDLPSNWQEGYLSVVDSEVSFSYGQIRRERKS